jgi:hypothetical protein
MSFTVLQNFSVLCISRAIIKYKHSACLLFKLLPYYHTTSEPSEYEHKGGGWSHKVTLSFYDLLCIPTTLFLQQSHTVSYVTSKPSEYEYKWGGWFHKVTLSP